MITIIRKDKKAKYRNQDLRDTSDRFGERTVICDGCVFAHWVTLKTLKCSGNIKKCPMHIRITAAEGGAK